MNERIKLLAEQSYDTVEYNYAPSKEFFNKQKFAELIIKECASLCEINGSTYKYSFTPARAMLAESASKYCGTMIKKHFGVEE
jgi:hypothetical protein